MNGRFRWIGGLQHALLPRWKARRLRLDAENAARARADRDLLRDIQEDSENKIAFPSNET
jgi:hypothetical protein